MLKYTEWPLLAKNDEITNEDLYERLEKYWSMVASLSGLIAGFTYVITNQEIGFISEDAHTRREVFGCIGVGTFLTALIATILALTLYGYLNLGGLKHVKWFVIRYWMFIDAPLVLSVLSLILMLSGTLVAIGGLYGNSVYVAAIVIGAILVLPTGILFIDVKRQIGIRLAEDEHTTHLNQNQNQNESVDHVQSTN
eukprot:383516_1